MMQFAFSADIHCTSRRMMPAFSMLPAVPWLAGAELQFACAYRSPESLLLGLQNPVSAT
jgi:hypothetical protein